MQRLLSFLSGLLFFSFVSSGNAQVSVKVNVENKVVALNGYVRIQYRLDYENDATSFTPPPFANFTIVQGPEQITGMQNINGQVSNYSTFSYVLKPSKKGRFIFPPAKATMDGKLFQSASVTVEVNEHGAPMRINGSGGGTITMNCLRSLSSAKTNRQLKKLNEMFSSALKSIKSRYI
jgi:hypothetical protein